MLTSGLRSEIVDLLLCPVCGAHSLRSETFLAADDGAMDTGVLCCSQCRGWFPVEEGILELLAAPLAYREDRLLFWGKNESRLRALGLAPLEPEPEENIDHATRGQQAHFDWYAENPEQTYGTYEASAFWRGEDAIAFEPWRREVRPGSRLLDIGCAQGRSTFPWADLDLEILAFDISKRMIRQAVERYRRGSHRARATFFVGDARRLPVVSGTFDYVSAYGVLHHLPDPEQTCREIKKALRPGGVYFGSENNKALFRAGFDLLQRIWPLWHEEAGSHPLISQRDIRRWLEPLGGQVTLRTSIFLPPHLVSLLDSPAAEKLLRLTDGLARSFPFLRWQGGLLLIRAQMPS